ncbi:MAG: hypothetical protein KDA28_04530, partial [Phycisphaerales bacterium]|nr:hypothetical protein [Phycisphaerales bacterium]
ELEAERLEENGFFDDMVEHLEPLGTGDAEGLCIGTTGGGEEALLMVADDTQPGGYVIYLFAYDGVPYGGGSPLEAVGQVGHLLRRLSTEGDLDPVLQTLLADAEAGGLIPAAAEPPVEEEPADGIVLRRVDEPVALPTEEKRARFAAAYEDDRILDAIAINHRTAGDRLAASVTGYPAGAFINHLLVADAEGAIILHDTNAQSTRSAWCAGHPTDERALLGATELLEMDLRTGETIALGPRPGLAGYLQLGDRERIVTVSHTDNVVRVWAHTPGQRLDETPLAEFPLGTGKWYDVGLFDAESILRPENTDEGLVYHLARFVESDVVTMETIARLRVRETDLDPSKRWFARRVGGQNYIVVDNAWFVLEVR